MKDLAEKLEKIVEETNLDVSDFQQLIKFENTIKSLEILTTLERPTYSLPHVDTIGRTTYQSLNKS